MTMKLITIYARVFKKKKQQQYEENREAQNRSLYQNL